MTEYAILNRLTWRSYDVSGSQRKEIEVKEVGEGVCSKEASYGKEGNEPSGSHRVVDE